MFLDIVKKCIDEVLLNKDLLRNTIFSLKYKLQLLKGAPMAKKRKTLPKDFSELLATANIETLKAVYEKCELDAYDGSNKESALFLRHIPDELVKWLVE